MGGVRGRFGRESKRVRPYPGQSGGTLTIEYTFTAEDKSPNPTRGLDYALCRR